MSLLEARGVCKYFGGLRAVDQVDFILDEGEIHAVIGPNGAGKTTFVSLLCGRLEVTAGEIHFAEQEITRMPAWRRARMGIAYTFQITSIYQNLSVFDNIAIAAQHARRDTASIDERVNRAIERVGLGEMSTEQAGTLAYGHQRILEVAMGLALEPKLLILDEPTQGLSDSEIEQFCGLVRQINTQSTILLIEHNMQVVMALAERITVLDQGRVLAQGNPDEIREDSRVQAAYLGTMTSGE